MNVADETLFNLKKSPTETAMMLGVSERNSREAGTAG